MGEVRTERHGTVLLATLHNPPHALMDRETVSGLADLVERAEREDAVRGVVLTGSQAGRFVAHYDVGEILRGAEPVPAVGVRVASASLRLARTAGRLRALRRALERTPLAGALELERFHDTFLRMNRCGAVFIAAINGSTQGGGSELSLACDRRLMARGDHVVGQPEILLGFPPGGGATQRLTRLMGTSGALGLVLDGRPITAERALEIGLVDELIEPGELVARAISEAERLGSRPKRAIAAAKRAIYEGGSLALTEGLHRERSEFMAQAGGEDALTAMRGYVTELERTGELPAYDEQAVERSDRRGSFGP